MNHWVLDCILIGVLFDSSQNVMYGEKQKVSISSKYSVPCDATLNSSGLKFYIRNAEDAILSIWRKCSFNRFQTICGKYRLTKVNHSKYGIFILLAV